MLPSLKLRYQVRDKFIVATRRHPKKLRFIAEHHTIILTSLSVNVSRLFPSLFVHHYHHMRISNPYAEFIFTLNIDSFLPLQLSSVTFQIILRVSSLSNIAKNKSKAIKTGKNVIESRQSTFENRTMNKGFKQTIENSLIKLFHFLVASHFFYSLYYDFTYVLPKEIPLRNYSFGSKLVYLTVLNAVSEKAMNF